MYVYHLNPRVKVICDPCDIILTIPKEDYTTLLYTKNRDFGHSTFKETNIIDSRIWYKKVAILKSKMAATCFDFFSRNLSNLCFYMLENVYLC